MGEVLQPTSAVAGRTTCQMSTSDPHRRSCFRRVAGTPAGSGLTRRAGNPRAHLSEAQPRPNAGPIQKFIENGTRETAEAQRLVKPVARAGNLPAAMAHGPTSHSEITLLVSKPDGQPGRVTQASGKGQRQAERSPSEAGSQRKAVHAEHTPVHAIEHSCHAISGGSASQGSKRYESLRRHSASQFDRGERPSRVAQRRKPPPRQIRANKDEGSRNMHATQDAHCAHESNQPPRHEQTDQGDAIILVLAQICLALPALNG